MTWDQYSRDLGEEGQGKWQKSILFQENEHKAKPRYLKILHIFTIQSSNYVPRYLFTQLTWKLMST